MEILSTYYFQESDFFISSRRKVVFFYWLLLLVFPKNILKSSLNKVCLYRQVNNFN